MRGVQVGVNPWLEEALRQVRAIHDLKNQDYSSGGPYENFEIVSFATGIDMPLVFLGHVANKTARLKSLYKQGGTANFESVEDSWLDLACYSAIGFSYVLSQKESSDEQTQRTSYPQKA